MRSSNLLILALSCLFLTSALSASRQPETDLLDEEQQGHGQITPYVYPSIAALLSSDQENRREVPIGCFSLLNLGIFDPDNQSASIFDSLDISILTGAGESFYLFWPFWGKSDPVDFNKKNQ